MQSRTYVRICIPPPARRARSCAVHAVRVRPASTSISKRGCDQAELRIRGNNPSTRTSPPTQHYLLLTSFSFLYLFLSFALCTCNVMQCNLISERSMTPYYRPDY
uniref:Uncharacterized protein n=1 Tax=Zea mays TaxID=4577 RepID=B8A044_MAIZE|nr:unknown [Zea mays]ACN27645.1 unknown [Zea mays]